jgi:hypothetical protein
VVVLGNFGETDAIAVSTDAVFFQGARPWSTFVVRSDRAIHIRRAADDTDEATTDDFLLTEGQYARVDVAEGEWLSFILADSETDGTVYVTRAS